MNRRPSSVRPRVLHVTQPTTGGVASMVRQSVEEAMAGGLQVAVASPAADSLSLDVQLLGARSLHWDAAPSTPSRGAVRRLRQLVERWDPDIVHLHGRTAGLAGREALRGSRASVYQPHEWSFEGAQGAAKRRATRRDKRAATSADVVICSSEAQKRRGVGEGVRGTPVSVIPSRVDLAAFYPGERVHAREDLGLPISVPMVVCVGALCPQMGQDVLLDSWPHVRDAVPDARLVLVGDGSDRRRLEARASAGVRFVGECDRVREWLTAADVVAVPSRWEATSRAALEAEACGRPVVATQVGGIIEHLSPVATVVRSGDVAGLAAALLESLGVGWGPEDMHRVRTFAEARSQEAPRVLDTYRQVLRARRT